MIPESEASTGAAAGYLELIDDLFPQFVVWNSLTASTSDHSLIQFAKIQFFSADRGHFEILNT